MPVKYLSTGQAARVCSVTPDTILKWIRSGRLPARRTPGGHHRIDRRDLDKLMRVTPSLRRSDARRRDARHFRYCWEYKGRGQLLDGCKDCVVYELRAARCYEVVKLAPDVGHSKLFCEGSCEDCDYYQHVQGQGTNVLVVTDDQELVKTLRREADKAGFNLEVTDCEYGCSALVQTFRPDFAVVDCALGTQLSSDITVHLSQDPRVPFVRVILAGTDGDYPDDCDHQVFARIDKPFGIEELTACATGVGEERNEARG